MAETVNVTTGTVTTQPGSAGVQSQVPGQATTVSGVAEATGGVGAGNLVEVDIDEELFKFESDDTPLMSLMLKSKAVNVQSPEVDHYMIDESRSYVTTNDTLQQTTGNTGVLPLPTEDKNIPRPYGTLLVKGVDGYAPDGRTRTPGMPLMLFVTGQDNATENPIVRAVNGPKTNPTDEYCKIPQIPSGSKCIILSNALYETQKYVDPDVIVPQPTRVYLQKRAMNTIVSDYFESQKKRIPFSEALIAEEAIRNFKVRGNRTLWAGRKGKFKVNTPNGMGMQYVYFTEGVRWQFKRELQHQGKWTYEQFIALAKMFYTGEDVPKACIVLAGKNFLEEIQCIDFSKHPEVTISVKTNSLGWEVTHIHTFFGDFEFKREPTLDRLGWSNSAAILGLNRLVHYKRTTDHSFDDDVEGEEAKRKGEIVWDALALKGSCHIWIDGEGAGVSDGATGIKMWDASTAPTGGDLVTGMVYYLLQDCPGISQYAQNGQMWKYNGTEKGWSEFHGEVFAKDDAE